MATNKLQIFGGAIFGLGVIGLIYYFISKKNIIPEFTYNDDFPLKVGSKGNNVTVLQQKLNAFLKQNPRAGISPLKVNGVFDNATLVLVKIAINGGATQVSKDDFDDLGKHY
jgi:hypothetical protein